MDEAHPCAPHYLIRQRGQRRRIAGPSAFAVFQIDDEIELGRPHHRQVGRPFALEEVASADADSPKLIYRSVSNDCRAIRRYIR
jgi:hypothetical protein